MPRLQPGLALRTRIRAALYDAAIDLFLRGYEDLAGTRLRPETGQMVVRLNRLMAAFDDRFETRNTSGASLRFDDVFADDLVQDRYRTLVELLAPHPEAIAIRDFLNNWIAADYDRYADLARSPESIVDLDRQLDLAMLDSAGFTLAFIHSVALFHGTPAPEQAITQFTSVGILGKLADDWLDFWEDQANGRINLLRGILHRHPDEEACALAAAADPHRRGLRWWRENCPRSIVDLAELLTEHRERVTSSPLLLVTDVMLLPARWGRTVMRSAPVGLRV